MSEYSCLNKEIYKKLILIVEDYEANGDHFNDKSGRLSWGKKEISLIANHAEAMVNQAKREAITELLALHEQDRAKVNSQCDTLINMSTVDKYLRGLNA